MKRTKYTKELLEPIVVKNISIRGILKSLGFSTSSGSMFYLIRDKIEKFNIDISHFKRVSSNKISLEKILVKNSSYSRTHLKRRLLKKGILVNKCSVCGLEGVWQNKAINMILDHVNGVSDDNRVKNLRMVCPNCNSQLDTNSGKNKYKK